MLYFHVYRKWKYSTLSATHFVKQHCNPDLNILEFYDLLVKKQNKPGHLAYLKITDFKEKAEIFNSFFAEQHTLTNSTR